MWAGELYENDVPYEELCRQLEAALARKGFINAADAPGTRDFFLLVVDAFSYQDLLKQQAKAPRLWTTFVALPQEEPQTFSQVLATMLRVATPCFGETTRGLQMFIDARATVKLGEPEVLDADVKAAAPGRK